MIIAVDFDGTIVEHAYPKIGKPIPFAIDVLKKLQHEERHLLILWTVREGRLLEDALAYCKRFGLEFYAVNNNYPEENPGIEPRKVNADLYIDDKNIGGIPDWGIIYNMIKSGSNGDWDVNDYVSNNNKLARREKNFLIRLGEAWDQVKGRSY
ncbi:MAG: hypothetical protein LBC48_09995 [Dysgonamonadaceae bacterium]|jgi:hypothetical protein|nr:hypothetical protein [Dysgonamonadaceae bacterium]